MQDLSKMTIKQIGQYISIDWGSKVSPSAQPYLEAMKNIENLDDMYGDQEDGAIIVSYFLSNAHQWKGESAKEIKKYLGKLLKDYYTDDSIQKI